MKFDSINRKVVQMAASNLQAIHGTSHLATDKWLLSTGSVHPFMGKKTAEIKPDHWQTDKVPQQQGE